MKKTHIIGLVVIAVAALLIISTAGDASVYASFDEAEQLAKSGNEKSIHVVGQLMRSPEGDVIGVKPSLDKLSVSFLMLDQNNRQQEVYYNEPMPTDLIMSEQVVVIGRYKRDLFIAEKILLKCPSKYEEDEINV